MPRARAYVIVASLATGVEVAAVCVGLGFGSLAWIGIGSGMHFVAALASLWAARLRRKDLSATEKDLVFLTALLVPVFGPAMAWSMPYLQEPGQVENAHEVFERYAEHVKPAAPDWHRTLFTGDYERDLARELDAESYYEVLRHGSTDQKRNALRRLADLGEKKHFQLIRGCLLDPEHEVRLYAYSELERAGREYELEIAKRSKELEGEEQSKEALMAMATAYYDYAASGIHDEEMAAWYFRSAERYAGQMPGSTDAVWLRVAALTRLGELEQAEEVLRTLTGQEQGLARSCLARADLAYRRRDFATAREEAARIRNQGETLPGWLAALEEVEA